MNTNSRILCVGLLSLTPMLGWSQNAPETEVLERHANYNRVRVLNALDPEQLAELPPEQRELLESEGATYIQAASGLNYFSEGEWKPSQERFIEYEDGIVAQEGQTKVIISKDFMDPNGVVDLLTPNGPGVEGERLRLSVAGLAIFDRKSGQSALIATPQPSRAILVPPNQVLFLNALTGDGVSADVRMSYRLGSFETDVILREFPEARDPGTGQVLVGPAVWGLSPEDSVIEVMHEVVSAPDPVKEARVLKEEPRETRDQFVEPDIIDEELTFGAPGHELKFVQGRAFALTDEEGEPLEDPAQRDRAVPTAKQWLDLDSDGVYLVEQVEYSSVRDALESLPRVQVDAVRQPVQGRQKMLASGGARPARGPGGEHPSRVPIGASRYEVLTASNASSADEFSPEAPAREGARAAVRGAYAPSRVGASAPAGSPSERASESSKTPSLPAGAGRMPALRWGSWDERFAALGNPLQNTGRQPAVPPASLTTTHNPPTTTKHLALVEDFERRPGFTIDYLTRSGSQQDMAFRGDETYYISGPFTISDTTVFEGGTVIKMGTDAYLSVPDDIEFQTAMYRVATITSKFDSTIGQYVASGTPTSTSYPAAFKFPNQDSYTLEHVRIRYASIAVNMTSSSTGSTTVTLRHAQIVNCYRGFVTARSATANLRNVLVSSCYTFLQGNSYGGYTEALTAQHLTAHDIYLFTSDWDDYMYLDNCLLTDVDYPPTSYSGAGNYKGPSTGVYQTVGAGEFYLADDTHRDQGTGTVDSTLREELEERTTYPPVVYGGSGSYTIDSDTVWLPAVPRDNDPELDRGFTMLRSITPSNTFTWIAESA